MSTIKPEEVSKLQAYLEKKFQNKGFALKMRDKAKDSVEVILNNEFMGLIYKDEDDGEVSFDFNMAILQEDL
jgi:hypothetical protein